MCVVKIKTLNDLKAYFKAEFSEKMAALQARYAAVTPTLAATSIRFSRNDVMQTTVAPIAALPPLHPRSKVSSVEDAS